MTIHYIKQKITPVLEEYGISYAGVFGSTAMGNADKDSDVDLIVRFGTPMGMIKYMRFIEVLEKKLKKKVDVVTEKSINKFFAPHIMPEVKTIYEK